MNADQRDVKRMTAELVNPYTFIGLVYRRTLRLPTRHVPANPLSYTMKQKPKRAKRPQRQRQPVTLRSVMAAAHLAAAYNRYDMYSADDEIAQSSSSPVPAFSFSSFLDLPPHHKRKADDDDDDYDDILNDNDDSDDEEIDVSSLPPRRPPTPPPSKRVRNDYDINDDLFALGDTPPCEELRLMAKDLEDGWIKRDQAKQITKVVFEEAKRTREGWRRRGVDCSLEKLLATCREEPELEWMFKIRFKKRDNKENKAP